MITTPELTNVLRVFSIGIPFSILLANAVGGIRGFQQMKYKTYADDILKKLVTLAGACIAIWFGYGIIGVTVAYVFAFAVAFLTAFYFLNSKYINHH